MKPNQFILALLCAFCFVAAGGAKAQSTALTYQGRLSSDGMAANGTFDLQFSLRDAATSGNQIGPGLVVAPLAIANGEFTVTLDFGAGVFTGAPRWLEIGVRTNGSVAPYTTLAPRQPITATPYAVQALSASNLLGYVADSQLSANIARANGNPTFIGSVSFNPLLGPPFKVNNASLVTNLNADFLDGLDSRAFAATGHVHSAGDITAGTLSDARLSANVPLLSRSQTFAASNTFAGVLTATNAINLIAGTFSGNGAALTNLGAANLTGAIADSLLSANVPRLNSNQTFSGAVTFNPVSGPPLRVNSAALVTNLNADLLDGFSAGAFWTMGGNRGTTNGNFIGTTDNQSLDLRVNGVRALRLIPTASVPNMVAGSAGNSAASNIMGAAIGGGGPVNTVVSNYATVGGGFNNTGAGVGATVSGGQNNSAGNLNATVPGGSGNVANGANSLAAGQNAQALHSGALVWADTSSAANFTSTAPNTVIFRAAGGVGIGTNAPQSALHVTGTVQAGGFSGSGASLTSLNASQLASGAVPNTRLGANVARLDTNQVFAGNNSFQKPVGIGTTNPQSPLHVEGTITASGLNVTGATTLGALNANLRLNHFDLLLRGDPDSHHGLGWYGSDVNFPNKLFAGQGIDGPVLYGWSGGGLGTTDGGQNLALTWSKNGNVTIDPLDRNDGAQTPGLIFGKLGSGEGIASKRTVDGNRYGLDFYTGYVPRLSIANNGNVGIGTTIPDRPLAVQGNEWMSFKNTSGSTVWHLNNFLGGLNFVQTGVADARLFLSTNNGNVGIGTASPSKPLVVQKRLQSEPAIMVGGGLPNGPRIQTYGLDVDPIAWMGLGTGMEGGPYEHSLYFPVGNKDGRLTIGSYDGANYSTKLLVDVNGYVGIGTISPSQKLHVAGNIYAAGTITPNSDRNAKTGFAPVDTAAVLDKVARLPIQQWRFKAEPEDVKHVGPMAQDFRAAFGLGEIPTAIATVDADGVTLAAIQGLNRKVEEKEMEIQQLTERVAVLEKLLNRSAVPMKETCVP